MQKEQQTQIISILPTLYNKTIGTNREKQWSTSVVDNGDNTFTIRSEYGVVGGKQVVHDSLITAGKNIGKKNETTVRQQALFESEREWEKKKKQGYNEVQECSRSLQKQKEEGNGEEKENKIKSKSKKTQLQSSQIQKKILKPMLANEFDMNKFKEANFPVFIQPKLDGVRCLVYKSNDEEGHLIFQSRQNTIYEEFKHLTPELQQLFNRFENQCDLILDGELYTHGMPFEKITSLVRSSKRNFDEIESLQYHIYDCFYSGENNLEKNTMPYKERLKVLTKAFSETIHSKLILVNTNEASSKEDIENYHTYFTTLENPYEGVMIRTPNGVYKQQGRSKDLQKYKKFMDEEFEVVGHHEGTGAHAGTPIFECKTNDETNNRTFGVTMQGTLESKRQMMENIVERFYGKMLTVKYQEKSAEGVPRFPVGIAFRDYE
jgi:DNA ligase-1